MSTTETQASRVNTLMEKESKCFIGFKLSIKYIFLFHTILTEIFRGVTVRNIFSCL